jgi:hypothetical protein
MSKSKGAEHILYDVNGGYKKPSPTTMLMIKISKIDLSWFSFEEHGLYRKGGPFDKNKEKINDNK